MGLRLANGSNIALVSQRARRSLRCVPMSASKQIGSSIRTLNCLSSVHKMEDSFMLGMSARRRTF